MSLSEQVARDEQVDRGAVALGRTAARTLRLGRLGPYVMVLPLVTTWMVSSPAVPDIARVSVSAPPAMVSTPAPLVLV